MSRLARAVSASLGLAALGGVALAPTPGRAQQASPAVQPAAEAPAPFPPEDRAAEPFDPFQGGTLTFQHENDAFVPKGHFGIIGTDRYYTAGQRLIWVSGSGPDHWFLKPLLRMITGPAKRPASLANPVVEQRWGWELDQNIYTPENIHTATPDPRDRPYAAWLSLGAMVITHSAVAETTVEVQLGVVGPGAVGGPTQNFIHRQIHRQFAQGWAHQLKNEPALLVTREDRYATRTLARADAPWGLGQLGMDFTPMTNLEVGNVQTSLSAGGGLRIGLDLADDFGPPRIRPGPSGASYYNGRGSGGYVFANLDGRVVAHDIFLDGNTFRSSPHVSKVPLGWEFETGFAVRIDGVRVTYAYVRRSREFHEQKTPDEFASISLTFVP